MGVFRTYSELVSPVAPYVRGGCSARRASHSVRPRVKGHQQPPKSPRAGHCVDSFVIGAARCFPSQRFIPAASGRIFRDATGSLGTVSAATHMWCNLAVIEPVSAAWENDESFQFIAGLSTTSSQVRGQVFGGEENVVFLRSVVARHVYLRHLLLNPSCPS
jgi:hypothetical protein